MKCLLWSQSTSAACSPDYSFTGRDFISNLDQMQYKEVLVKKSNELVSNGSIFSTGEDNFILSKQIVTGF